MEVYHKNLFNYLNILKQYRDLIIANEIMYKLSEYLNQGGVLLNSLDEQQITKIKKMIQVNGYHIF